MKKLSLMICVWIVGIVVLGGCKKPTDDDQDLDKYNTIKTAKFVITTTNLLASDNFVIHFTGTDARGAAQTIFKINGVAQANQANISLTNAQLKAGVTVESTTPLSAIAIIITGYSTTESHSFSFLFKPVINGTPGTDVSATLTYANSYNKDLMYK